MEYTTRLNQDEMELLADILGRDERLADVLKDTTLHTTAEQGAVLADLICDEFCRTGLGTDDEPTPRGLALDRLLRRIAPAYRGFA